MRAHGRKLAGSAGSVEVIVAFEQSFRRSAFALVMATVVLYGCSAVDIGYVLIFPAGVVAALFNEQRRWLVLSNRMLFSVMIVLAGVGILAGGILRIYPMTILVWLLSTILVGKLFQHKTNRDYVQVFALCLILFASASVTTVSIFFALVFVVLGAWLLWFAIVLNIKQEWDSTGRAGQAGHKQPAARQLGRSVLPVTSMIVVLTFIFSLFLFVAFPRVPGVIFAFGSKPQRSTGFSENVNLGAQGPIKSVDDTVMTVHVSRSKQPVQLNDTLYLRGSVLQFYTPSFQWVRYAPSYPRSRIFSSREYVTHMYSEQHEYDPQIVKVQVVQSPMTTDLLFSPNYIQGVNAISQMRIWRNVETMELVREPARPVDVVYSVYSFLEKDLLTDEYLMTSVVPPEDILASEKYYLDNSNVSERVRSLAREIVPAAATENPYETALWLKQYLARNYTYSTNVPRGATQEPIDFFLFESKKGHCELYASSFVMLARSLGIPARLVNGFAQGEYNELGKWYLFRKRHAHAWAEVKLFFPRGGKWDYWWVTVDPTPVGQPLGSGPEEMSLSYAASITDWIRVTWLMYVIEYDIHHQSALLKGAAKLGSAIRGSVEDHMEFLGKFIHGMLGNTGSDQVGPLAVVAIVVLVGIGVVVILVLLKHLLANTGGRTRRSRLRARAGASVDFYRSFLKLLARRGFKKDQCATPLEFASQVIRKAKAARRPVVDITRYFCEVRYGHHGLTPSDRDLIKQHLSSLAHME